MRHEWDLDVAFDELLPCAAPRSSRTETTARTTRAVTRATRDERRLVIAVAARSRQQLANDAALAHAGTAIEAFLKGEDLLRTRALRARRGVADAGGPGVGAELA